MYYKKAALKFSCTGCGGCCYGKKDSTILLKENEAENIRSFLRLSFDWFRRRYLTRLHSESPQEAHGMVIDDNGKCVFLDNEKRCRIYSVRPMQCKTYPFWPERVLCQVSIDGFSETRSC